MMQNLPFFQYVLRLFSFDSPPTPDAWRIIERASYRIDNAQGCAKNR
jgi:hypothetical protein